MIDNSNYHESNLEREYDELCTNNGWNVLFQKIKNNASFKMMNNECKISRSEENRFKNKYREIVPYDYNRILLPRSSYFNSDYINASLVKIDKRSYIVTQYPSRTRDLFWLMVWHFKSLGIILLGKFEESESELYFPKTENDLYIRSNDNQKIIFSIKLLEMRTSNGFYQRKLRIFNFETDVYHDLWHFEFWPWPDHRAPKCLYSFLTLMGIVRQLNILDCPENPAIIHCSAGAGRSGTFCLIDILILKMEKYQSLDNLEISEIIEELRVQRMGMVHSIFQLKFSYQAIIEAFKRYKFKPSAQLNGSYLLCDEEANISNKYELFSSSSSESAASDTIYYQISDEDDESDISDTPHSENLFNNFNQNVTDAIRNDSNSILQEQNSKNNEIRYNRNQIICQRKLKNQQDIDKLSKHLEEKNMKRFRLISNIPSSSTISIFEEINNNYHWSLVIVGSIFVMGACLWLKYNPFK